MALVEGLYGEMLDDKDGLLPILLDARVLSIKRKNGGFRVMEECDRYFDVSLTAEQLVNLGYELIALGEQSYDELS